MLARAAIDQASTDTVTDIDGLEGVHLILRQDGRPVAATSATRVCGSAHPLKDALAALLAEVRRQGGRQGLPDALFRAGLSAATLELDAAGPLVPLTGRGLDLIGRDLDPATSGIAVRVDDQWHIRYPAALRMTGGAATAGMVEELAMVAGLTPSELSAARLRGQAAIYRFDTIDLVQVAGEFGPRHFQRGLADPLWPDTPLPAVAALTLAGRNLVNRLWLAPDGGDWLLGSTYHPSEDLWRPLNASARDRAFAALALKRLSGVEGIPPDLSRQAGERSTHLAASLPNDDPVIEAAKLVLQQQADRAAVLALLHDPSAPLVERSIAAWAIASCNEQPDAAVSAFLDHATLLPPSTALHALPWLAWADGLTAHAAGAPRRMETLWHGLDRLALADVPSRKVTADMLPIAAFLASEPADTGDSTMHQPLRVLQSLLVGPREAVFFRSPARATGGIKLAAWDERMPLWSQTMGILLLCEAAAAPPPASDPKEPST